MNKALLKNLLPYFTAIILFIIISFAFMNPVLEGKKMKQNDITIFKGMSKEIVDFREENPGEEPLWTNGMFGGMPAYQISAVYPNNWVKKIDKALRLGMPHPVFILFLYMLGFFIFMVILGVNPWLALIGSFAFAFSSYFLIIIEAGHNTKAIAIAYMAPIIGGIILTYRGKLLLGGIITAMFASLEIAANHFQITYYLLLFIIVLVVFIFADHIKRKELPQFFKASAILLVAALLAVAPSISNLWATQEYSAESMRGKSHLIEEAGKSTQGLDPDYITQWSYGIGETWSLLFPNVKGGGSGALANNKKAMEEVDPRLKQAFAQNRISSYWGDQPFTSGPTYAGAIIIFLFVLGLFLVKGALKWALLAGTIMSITLAWGKNFMPLTSFFIDYVPLYGKFRAASMFLVLAEFTIPTLAILAVWEIVKKPDVLLKNMKAFYISFGLTGGLLLAFYLLPELFFNFLSQMEAAQLDLNNPNIAEFVANMEAARMSIFKADAIRSFIYISLMAITLWAFSQKKINKSIFFIAFAVLLLADMISINKRYINDDNFARKRKVDNPYTPSVADQAILKDKSPDYRVLNLGGPFADGRTSFYHKSIGGYHSAKLGRYQDMIDYRLDGEIQSITTVLGEPNAAQNLDKVLQKSSSLNMLNTKYIIYNPQTKPIVNPYANGNAWFVSNYEFVENGNEEINGIALIDTKTTALIDKGFKEMMGNLELQYSPLNTITLESYKSNHLVYKTNSKSKQLAIFSEIHYPKGWNAYIDGESAEHFRADYILRALIIPAGTHKIEFKFEPKSYYIGEKIALIGSILLLLSFIGIMAWEARKYFHKTTEESTN